MEKHLTEDCNDLRQYRCLRKYEEIVNQFDEVTEMVDAITNPRKRRRISNPKRNKSVSAAGASNSASVPAPINREGSSNLEAAEGDSSTMVLASKAEKSALLEQIITRHLDNLQTHDKCEF